MTEQQARIGYAMAVRCANQSAIPYNKIKKKIIPGKGFSFQHDTVSVYIGYAFTRSLSVWVAEAYKDHAGLWAHEFLHILGPTDTSSEQAAHPDSLFKRCNL